MHSRHVPSRVIGRWIHEIMLGMRRRKKRRIYSGMTPMRISGGRRRVPPRCRWQIIKIKRMRKESQGKVLEILLWHLHPSPCQSMWRKARSQQGNHKWRKTSLKSSKRKPIKRRKRVFRDCHLKISMPLEDNLRNQKWWPVWNHILISKANVFMQHKRSLKLQRIKRRGQQAHLKSTLAQHISRPPWATSGSPSKASWKST